MTSRFTRIAASGIALALAATALPISSAEAGHRGWGKHHHHYHYYHRDRGGAAVAAGIFGLAAGAMLGSALSQPRYYAPPPPVHYYPPASYVPAPWTPDWYTYCASKYRSFNAHTGMYLTYRGDWVVCH